MPRRISDDALINIVAILAIGTLVATGLIVGAVVPTGGDNVNLVVSVGVTGIAGFARRSTAPNAPPDKPRE